MLQRHGWRLSHRSGDNEHWIRPGKAKGTSATLKDGTFYVFTSNAAPFEPMQAYSPFAAVAMLDYHGDFEAAASALGRQGYGSEPDAPEADISALLMPSKTEVDAAASSKPADPGPLPESMLRVPGFVSEVMDHCLATAPYPNPTLAFCGALSLQAFLAGRKVRDPADVRTNLYLLGLAHSSAGKDHPRKINAKTLFSVGLAGNMGEQMASGEGLEDALYLTPAMLFQTDEIDGMLQSMKRAKDARHESIMGKLLSMYSSASTNYNMRRKANAQEAHTINQPCLTIFGTAIPNHYYAALSERMLTNGLFARMLVLEAGKRGKGQEPSICDPPQSIIDAAAWWSRYRPQTGNLADENPEPTIVPMTEEAKRLVAILREKGEDEYDKAQDAQDAVATTVWGRVAENARKLALLYAISEDRESPMIGREAVEWASELMLHQTRRMLFMASSYAAEGEFDEQALRVMRCLREAGGWVRHSALLRRMKLDTRSFRELMKTLTERGDVVTDTKQEDGRPGTVYGVPECVSGIGG